MTYKRITISIEIDISYLYQSIISLTSPMNTISGVMTKMVKVLETTAGGRFSGCRKMCWIAGLARYMSDTEFDFPADGRPNFSSNSAIFHTVGFSITASPMMIFTE